jgi:branched-chain amino acid transport system substrate-binding protein
MNRLAGLATVLVFGLCFASSAAFAQVSDGVVKIGVLEDMSGPYADNSGEGSLVATRMAVEDFGGKVLGKPIEIVSADMQNKVDIGAGIARSWYDREKVDMITAMSNSAIALAVQQISLEKNRINLTTGAATAELTAKSCSPNGAHWVYDTYALGKGTARGILKGGGDTWFFITVNYTFGYSLEKDATTFINAGGGKVLGSVHHPLDAADFSSYLVQAQASKAKIIAVASGGSNLINVVKQAGEFGITQGGQKLAALIINNTDVHSIGLKLAQGLVFTYAFYQDLNDETRAFSNRFAERMKHPPTMIQAGTYSAVNHYLKAVQAAGTDEAKAVMVKMKATPINDFMTKNGRLREDGRVIRDMYLVQVKTPQESKGEWDLLKLVATIPGDEAFRPLAEGGCPNVKF